MEQTLKQWQSIWSERDTLPGQVKHFLSLFIQLSLAVSLCEGLIQAFYPGTEWQGMITCGLFLPISLGVLWAWQKGFFVIASNLTFGFLGLLALQSALVFPVANVVPFSTLMIGAIAYIVFLELEKFRTGTILVKGFTLLFVLHFVQIYFPDLRPLQVPYTWSFQYFPLLKTLIYLGLFGSFILPFFRRKRKSQRQLETAIKAQRELYKQALQEQKELAKMRMHFVAAASHQFRTPLTIIKSNTFLLKQHLLNDAPKVKLKQSVQRIEKEYQRLKLLIENIMILGKHSDKDVQLPLEPMDMTQMITKLIKETIEPMCQCRISIEVIGSERLIYSHPLLLEHVILNLISNALKYSKGAPSPFIQIRFLPQSCQITVQDYGIGIAPKDQAQLFQAFYRGQNVQDIPGTGLGLVIARELIEKLNGSIQLSSKLNEGTKVIVDLPKTTPS